MTGQTPPDSERWAVYRALRLKRLNYFWLFTFLFSLIIFLASWLLREFFPFQRPAMGTLLVLSLLFWLYVRAWTALTFPSFQKWRGRLPFKLAGWERLVDERTFGDAEYWRDGRIAIRASRGSSALDEALRLAAERFCQEAPRLYYRSKSPSPGRQKWSYDPGKRTLSGSLNCDVAAGLYLFLKGPLAALAGKYPGLTGVEIETAGGNYRVERADIEPNFDWPM